MAEMKAAAEERVRLREEAETAAAKEKTMTAAKGEEGDKDDDAES